MKHIILFLLAISLITIKADCQVFGNIIERTIQPTVLIEVGKGSASGILVQDSTARISLITAKHVLFDSETNFSKLNDNKAIVYLYAKDFRKDSATHFVLDLPKLIKSNNLKVDSLHDILIVKLGFAENSGAVKYYSGVYRAGHSVNYNPYYFDNNSIVFKDDLYLGEDLFVVGFPTSIGLKQIPQFDYYKPLLKRGAIASVSHTFDNYIIDCPVYHGNSGGPVFLERKGFDNYSLRLIGIVTQFIPLINKTLSQNDLTEQNSSYGVIVPIEYGLKLVYE